MPVSVGDGEGNPQQKRKWGRWALAGGILGVLLVGAIAPMRENFEKEAREEALKEAVIFARRTYQAEFTNDPNKPTFLSAYQAFGGVEVSLEVNDTYEQFLKERHIDGKRSHAQLWCRTAVTEQNIELQIVLLNQQGEMLATGTCPY